MEGVSVIICCYNSASRLPKTLDYLVRQVVDGIPWEIIVVNNNSTDQTVEVANSTWNKNDCNADFKIIQQPKAGLAFARELGIHTAKYDSIIFCDDDNWLQKDYVRLVYELLSKNPSIGVVGGQCFAVTDSGKFPDWWEKEKGNYAVGAQHIQSGDITDRKYVWGAGMAFKKAVFQGLIRSGFTSVLTDRKGLSLSSGGDSELSAAFILAGYKLWYDERLQLQHYIPAERLKEEYLSRLHTGLYESYQVLYIYHLFIDFRKMELTRFHIKVIVKGILKVIVFRKLTLFEKAVLIYFVNGNLVSDISVRGVYKNYKKLIN